MKQPYTLLDNEEEEFDDGEEKSNSYTSIDLECPSEGSENKKEPTCFEEGDYGTLYDKEDKDEEEVDKEEEGIEDKGKGKAKSHEDDGDDEEDAYWMEDE